MVSVHNDLHSMTPVHGVTTAPPAGSLAARLAGTAVLFSAQPSAALVVLFARGGRLLFRWALNRMAARLPHTETRP